jgi:glycosyltransferase involved in cell wall biosynthesis
MCFGYDFCSDWVWPDKTIDRQTKMKRILYIQVGKGFWHPNKHIIDQLKIHFPEYEIELLDIMVIIKKQYGVMFFNAICTFFEYFTDLITFKKSFGKFRAHFMGSSFFFKALSKIVRQHVAKNDYAFIFQTQSMCDSTNSKGIPFFIYTDHTNLFNQHYSFSNPVEFLHSKKYVSLEKKAFENARAIFVMSENIQESLFTQYRIDSPKVKLVYVSTNTTIASDINPAKYRNKNILFVGKDWERKGGPLLVEAFKQVRASIPNATLTILGCSPKVGIENCFESGEVSLDEVAQAYEKASVFCLPTQREPFGIVFLEAMFYRLPVITNRTGATPFIIEDGKSGYLLNNTVAEYAQVLTDLLNNPQKCEAMGEQSLEIARRKYTWNNVGMLMADTIKSAG